MADDANWGPILSLVNPDAPVAFLADDIELPYADDLNLSMRWALPGSSGWVTLSYIHRDYRNPLGPEIGQNSRAE